jgi:hypothetical protein
LLFVPLSRARARARALSLSLSLSPSACDAGMPGMENVKVFGRDDMDRMLKDKGKFDL